MHCFNGDAVLITRGKYKNLTGRVLTHSEDGKKCKVALDNSQRTITINKDHLANLRVIRARLAYESAFSVWDKARTSS